MLSMLIVGSTVSLSTMCGNNDNKEKVSWLKRVANTVYDHRLKCALVPLLNLGAYLQYHYGWQNLSKLCVVVPDNLYGFFGDHVPSFLLSHAGMFVGFVRPISQYHYDRRKNNALKSVNSG